MTRSDGTATAGRTRPNPWSPLRVRLFRALWIASLVSNVGTYMHTVAAGWVATDLTDSPALISLVQTAWASPGFLLALVAGAIADALDRRRVILVTQLVAMALAVSLGVLDATGALDMPLLLLLTFLLSAVLTVAAPAFMAVTPDLVGPEDLPQALGLNAISTNLAQSAGPAVAGAIIAVAGTGAVFTVNALSFLGIVFVVLRHRLPVVEVEREPMGAAMRTGVRFVVQSPRLRVLAVRLLLTMVLSSALVALLPVVARSSLEVSGGEFGLLSAAMGVGAVAAVWLLPRLNARVSPDVVASLAAGSWAAGVLVVALTTTPAVAMAGLLLVGAGMMATVNVLFAAYTLRLPSWVRGRASSVAMLVVWLGTSVGATAWGALAGGTSVRTTLVASAVAQVAVTVVSGWVLPIVDRRAPEPAATEHTPA
ncbi:MAG: MFS transporter [Actinomycetes bacterium]